MGKAKKGRKSTVNSPGRWRVHRKPSKVRVIQADGSTGKTPARPSKRGTYWQSKAWRRLRHLVMVRDDGRCVTCKRRAGDDDPRLKPGRQTILEVHHKTYERYGHEDLADLVLLCQRCHATEHQWLKRERKADRSLK